eukprot:TRINITY_DN2046_c0_g2_i1.p1 TRINITY_DN2046_c0_g2~~TRINITY_DN2046_c0_g2_i1.p1  ORF type:complete len:227 (+),score=16.39 TRINITY_DN2046_c0_g2_i1:85-765(+)
MRETQESVIMVLITVLTNCCCFPTLLLLYRKRFYWELFISIFTFLTSFMYHLCQSIDSSLWLSELQWHRLDNVFSIQCFICLFIFYISFRDPGIHLLCGLLSFGVVLILQEKAPWDERYTLFPVLFALFSWIIIEIMRRKSLDSRVPWLQQSLNPQHRFNRPALTRGLLILFVAALCFARALDDTTDPYRFFHGCWHCFAGISSYFLWQALPPYWLASTVPSVLPK